MNTHVTQRFIIDLEPVMHQYRRSAPQLLSSYVDFKDFIDIIVNVEPLPYYQEEVAALLYEIIMKKQNNPQLIVDQNAEVYDHIDLFVNNFIQYVDAVLMQVITHNLGNFNYQSYSIDGWVDYKSPILLIKGE